MSARMPLPMSPIVVSKPAIRSPIACESSSGGVRRSPASSAPPASGDQLVEVRRQRRAGGLHLGERLGGKELGGEAERRLRRPHREAVAVRDRDAQHLADDGRGHGERQVGDHVHRAAPGDPVQAAVDDALDLRAQRRDGARREGAAHQAAEPRVGRGILLQHEQALAGERLVHAGQDAVGRAHARRHLVQQPVHVGVAREAPDADRHLVDRIDLAQAGERGVGVVAEGRVERVAAEPGVLGGRGGLGRQHSVGPRSLEKEVVDRRREVGAGVELARGRPRHGREASRACGANQCADDLPAGRPPRSRRRPCSVG